MWLKRTPDASLCPPLVSCATHRLFCVRSLRCVISVVTSQSLQLWQTLCLHETDYQGAFPRLSEWLFKNNRFLFFLRGGRGGVLCHNVAQGSFALSQSSFLYPPSAEIYRLHHSTQGLCMFSKPAPSRVGFKINTYILSMYYVWNPVLDCGYEFINDSGDTLTFMHSH